MSLDSWYCVNIEKNNAMELEEMNNIEIRRLKFILKQHVSHRAVGARTMHRFGAN